MDLFRYIGILGRLFHGDAAVEWRAVSTEDRLVFLELAAQDGLHGFCYSRLWREELPGDWREILQRERSIEFLYEARRYHDIRRWKTAPEIMVRKPKAWNMDGTTAEEFYQVTDMRELMERVWKSYWLAIPIQEMNVNTNLVQNPGY